MNLCIIFSDFGPYHAARIDALSASLDWGKHKLYAVQIAAKSDSYSWKSCLPLSCETSTLLFRQPKSVYSYSKLIFKYYKFIKSRKLDLVFLPGYSPLANFILFLVTHIAGVKKVLMIDSWFGTQNSNPFVKIAKRVIIPSFDSALVAGSVHVQYIRSFGLNVDKIHLGFDVVDVEYFKERSKHFMNLEKWELPLKMPSSYFLYLGRFVPKKNLPYLLTEYAEFKKRYPESRYKLVMVGSGPEESSLIELASSLNLSLRRYRENEDPDEYYEDIIIYPFQQIELTPLVLSHATALVLPSTHEEWGLVVNEAMSSSTAVVISTMVGCREDLLVENFNGFSFDPNISGALVEIFERFEMNTYLGCVMGKNGSIIISNWGLPRFVNGALAALRSAYDNVE